MIISSVVIVFVGLYLLIKVMNENPVVGDWIDDEGNYAISIQKNGKLYVTDYTDGEEEGEQELHYNCGAYSSAAVCDSTVGWRILQDRAVKLKTLDADYNFNLFSTMGR